LSDFMQNVVFVLSNKSAAACKGSSSGPRYVLNVAKSFFTSQQPILEVLYKRESCRLGIVRCL
jgi:hypothetical protein